jgi:predicted nuclease of predicted toxin-antitoxin system
VKVYLDEDLSPAIAALLRKKGLDATTAYEAGNVQLDDRAQLAHATRDGRAIVPADVVDFVELAHEAVATNTEHAGIIGVPSSFVEMNSRRSRMHSSRP